MNDEGGSKKKLSLVKEQDAKCKLCGDHSDITHKQTRAHTHTCAHVDKSENMPF